MRRNKRVTPAGQRLKAMGEVISAKGKDYGRFERIGEVMAKMYPNGITLKTPADFNRFIIFVYMANKLVRNSSHLPESIHDDSILDVSVYGAMLLEINDRANAEEEG